MNVRAKPGPQHPTGTPSETRFFGKTWFLTLTMNFFDHEHTLNIAHQGASAVAPPNTLAAFEKASELGADGVELDVHLSADGVPVVIHDFTVDGTTDGSGRVAEMTLTQLKQLDAGSTFDPAFAGERIPTLKEVLDAVGSRLLLNIELKSFSLRDDGLERAVIARIEQCELADRVILSSFNPFSLRRAKNIAPRIPAGLLYAPHLSLPLRRAWLAFLVPHEARHPEHTMVDARYMAWARQHSYRVNTWTVDDPTEMRRLTDLQVDSIITNVPDVLCSLLATA
ncbi:MAG: glycerophosphodiester phosphodiesterase [Chloroflexota bacterium]|nr:glycerophosphodiester phosphodiesterase [Chloroflexota bacterium]